MCTYLDMSLQSIECRALRTKYTQLLAMGVQNLHDVSANEPFNFKLVDGAGPEGEDVNPTVCGIHSKSDLGQYMIHDCGFL